MNCMNCPLSLLRILFRLASSLHSRTSHRPNRNPSRPLQPGIILPLLLAAIEVLGKEVHLDTLIKKEENEITNIDKMIIGGRVGKETIVPGPARLIDVRMVISG